MVADPEIYGKIGGGNARIPEYAVKRFLAGLILTLVVAAVLPPPAAHAGFQSPESLVRNVYAWYGESSPGYAGGMPRDGETARQFFDPALLRLWLAATAVPYDFFVQGKTWKISALSIAILRKEFDRTYVAVNFNNRDKKVALNFIVVKDRDGWLISDVETPHDSLRLFLSQFRN